MTRAEIVETLRREANWQGMGAHYSEASKIRQALEAAAAIVERWENARWLADYALGLRGVEDNVHGHARRVLEVDAE